MYESQRFCVSLTVVSTRFGLCKDLDVSVVCKTVITTIHFLIGIVTYINVSSFVFSILIDTMTLMRETRVVTEGLVV